MPGIRDAYCNTFPIPNEEEMKEDVREFTASPAAELREQNRLLVTTVARAYREAKELPVICAGSFDPAPVARSKKWTPEICHFIVDVENAIAKVTTNKPDKDALLAAWDRLQEEDAVIGRDGARFIRLAAPILHTRGLHPAAYFRVIRHGSASIRKTR